MSKNKRSQGHNLVNNLEELHFLNNLAKGDSSKHITGKNSLKMREHVYKTISM